MNKRNKKIQKKLYIQFLVAVMLFTFFINVVNAYMSCEIKYDDKSSITPCDSSINGNVMFRIYDEGTHAVTGITNRHISYYNDVGAQFPWDYSLAVCCNQVSGHSYIGKNNEVLRMFSYSGNTYYGSHTEQNNLIDQDYSPIYFGTKENNVECVNYESTTTTKNGTESCNELGEEYTCAIKLYQESDSHVSSCDVLNSVTPISVCCRQNVNIPGWKIIGPRPDSVTLVTPPARPTNPDLSKYIPSDDDFGNKALNITILTAKSGSGIATNNIAVKPNTKYEASVWVYITESPENNVKGWVLAINQSNEITSSVNYVYIKDETFVNSETVVKQWIRLSRTFTTNSDTTHVSVMFTTKNDSDTKGIIILDDFNLVKVVGNQNLNDPIPYLASDYSYGCCNANECWNGKQCIEIGDLRTSYSQWPYPVCLDDGVSSTNWSLPYKKEHWMTLKDKITGNYIFGEQWNYCPLSNQCWQTNIFEDYTSYSATNFAKGCLLPGDIGKDRVCNVDAPTPNEFTNDDGWGSQTQVLLANILTIADNLKEDNYTIVCDSADCFTSTLSNSEICSPYSVTCVYRSQEKNTIIVGIIYNKSISDVEYAHIGNINLTTACRQRDQKDHKISNYLYEVLGIQYGDNFLDASYVKALAKAARFKPGGPLILKLPVSRL